MLGVKQFYALYQIAFSVDEGVVVTIDPDMEENIEDALRFYKEIINGKLLVFGAREQRNDVTWIRVVGSRYFNNLLKWLFKIPVKDLNTPMIMFCSSLSVQLREFPEAAGYPKFYFPYVLGDKFCEIPIVVRSKPKRSGYSWSKLLMLALEQIKQAYQFSRYIKKP